MCDAKMADFVTMSQMSDDENKSSRLSYTCEISTKTDLKEEIISDHLFRHVTEELVSTPRTKPRKTKLKENLNLQSKTK